MDSQRGWTCLSIKKPDVPKLLFKYAASSSGYQITLTDLTNIWQENLSTVEISHRAEQDECSISPGDDQNQLRILTSKIEEGLCHTNDARVDLCESPLDDINLCISATLPHPLPTFRWRSCLAKESQLEVTNELLTPLLSFALQQQHQIAFLTAQLRDKDHVIDRILQKTESSNTDLGAVFPGMSGIRKSQKIPQREQFAKHVKGLAPFKPGSEKGDVDLDVSDENLLGILGQLPVDKLGNDFAAPTECWWRKPIAVYGIRPQQPKDLDDDETDDDLDFQVQMHSSHPKDPGSSKLQRPGAGPAAMPLQKPHSTPEKVMPKDEDFLSSPLRLVDPLKDVTEAQSMPLEQTLTQARALDRRLGAIGGRSQRSSQAVASQSSICEAPIGSTEDDIGYGSRNRTSETPPPTSIPSSTLVSPAKRRLGAIGGRRSSSQSTQLSTQRLPSPTPTPSEGGRKTDTKHHQPSQTTYNKQSQLGTVDEAGRSRAEKSEENVVEQSRPRETSEERANRKREQLKRQLEAQAKARSKKKRRF